MSTTIISFITITISLLGLLFWCIKEQYEGWTITLVVTLVIFGIFGWGVFLTSATDVVKVEYKQAKVLEILKGKHITVVSTSDNHNQIYSDYESDMIDSTITFKWKFTNKYNYYGYRIEYTKEFIAEHDTSKNTIPKVKLER